MSLRFLKTMKITLSLAGIPLALDMEYEDYLPLYEKFITDENALGTARVSSGELEKVRAIYPPDCPDAYLEHMELCPRISNLLLNHNRVFFHGTAFVWQGKAWIFSGPSGAGKTTQYALWKLVYGDEVRMLNGDKPVLEFSNDGITVHPSPWRGKENMGQQVYAPLGGIILLEQSDEDRMERMEKNAIIPVFRQFLYCVDRDSVRQVFALEDKLLRTVPIWRFYNRGYRESAQLCHDTLEEVLK